MCNITKTCSKCKNTKGIGDFGKNRSSPDGLAYYCNQCKKEYRQSNKDKIATHNEKYYQANKDKIILQQSGYRIQYRQNNKLKIAEQVAKYYQNNKSKITEYKKHYDKVNKNKIAKRKAKYRKDNKSNFAKHKQDRLKKDIKYKLTCNLRNGLNKALKRNQKTGSAIKDLGCSIDFLKQYLESLFKPGMTWDNYGNKEGQWSIDHIKPLSKFDLTDKNQLLMVCHYTNLQPLWHIDNMRKGNR